MTDEPGQSARFRAIGRKSIRASARPRELMTDAADLAGVWKAVAITLFPQVFPGVLGESLTGRALKEGLWQLRTVNLRDFGEGRHRNVDDTPAGGGPGMVLRADVVAHAVQEAQAEARAALPVICLTPRGRRFDQAMARDLARGPGVILLCGRFEGVDERVIARFGMREVSIGDYVLTGGELAAQVLIDATVRLIPRVLGNQASVEAESFTHGLLEHPQYTKPAVWEGRAIPEILLSGHHAEIATWRQTMAERLTKERRPDLWRAWCAAHGMDPDEDREL